MKTVVALIAFALALVVGLAVAAAPASAATPANVPTWHVGQAVGYGTNLDLTGLVQPVLNAYSAQLNTSGATVHALTFTGSLDIWVVDTVTGATSTTYTLSEQSAAGLKFHLVANLSTMLPVAGTYPGNVSSSGCLPSLSVPTAEHAIAVTVDWSSLENGTSLTNYQAADLKTSNQVANATVRAQGTLAGADVPNIALNSTTCEETVSYQAQNLAITVNTQSSTRITYVPALDTFHFPITDNNTWWTFSNATVGGNVAGTINVQGLSAADEQAFFENVSSTLNSVAGISVTGLNGFPIDLTKITVMAGLNNVLKDGTIQDYQVPLAEEFRASAAIRTLGDQQQHSVYLIGPASYACPAPPTSLFPTTFVAIYAPDYPAAGAGMVAGYEALMCLAGTNQTVFSLGSVPVSQASSNQQATQTNYNPFPSSSNAVADFFLASPYLGLILIAVVVVAIAAVVVVRGRRKRRTAPPPQNPPPPGPP